jgi:outer membrane protein OmpA-like peptidoglycan-associated protein
LFLLNRSLLEELFDMSDEENKEESFVLAFVLGLVLVVVLGVVAGVLALVNGGDSKAAAAAGATNSPSAAVIAAGATAAGTAGAPMVQSAAAKVAADAQPSAPAPATPAAPAAPAASATAPDPLAAGQRAQAKIYFASGSIAAPAEAAKLIEGVVAYARSKPESKLAISGYHDKTGSPEKNAELAKNRAKIVKDLLISAGVPEGRLVMQKPQETTGAGDDREARRVEVNPVQ